MGEGEIWTWWRQEMELGQSPDGSFAGGGQGIPLLSQPTADSGSE